MEGGESAPQAREGAEGGGGGEADRRGGSRACVSLAAACRDAREGAQTPRPVARQPFRPPRWRQYFVFLSPRKPEPPRRARGAPRARLPQGTRREHARSRRGKEGRRARAEGRRARARGEPPPSAPSLACGALSAPSMCPPTTPPPLPARSIAPPGCAEGKSRRLQFQ